MKTRIYGSDLKEMLIEADYNTWVEEKSEPILERTFSAEIFLGSGSFKEVFYEGVHIGYGNICLYNDTTLHFERDFEVVKIVFSLGGSIATESQFFNKTIALVPGTHNIYYSNCFKGLTQWSCYEPIRTFEINLSPSFFNRLKLINHSMFDKFREAILKKEPAILSKHDMPITLKMHGIINSIINCDRVGIFKRMYMESQVISLLLLQIEQFCDIHKNTSSKPVSKKNMDKMYMVKEMLETNFKKSDTLVDIAKKVGTNEFTLKTCFKELFGVSVFQYWKGLRLEAAKSMLLEEGLSVQEVSRKIGYKNPQHFTTAFKKQFGVVPSRLRN